MRRKLFLRLVLTLMLIAGVAAWWLGTSATVEDTTPLTQGPINKPIGFGRALVSRLFLNVRLDLTALEKGIKASIPAAQKITNDDPKVDATLRVSEFNLHRASSQRLGAKAKLQIDGGLQWGIFTAKDMTLNAQGDVALSLSPAWEWQVAPNLAVAIEKVDARPGIPDWLAKWIINQSSGWFVPGLVKDITNSLPPPKPLVQDLWQRAQQRITVLDAPRVELSSEPVAVLLRQPVLDKDSNDLDLGLGVEARFLADVSAESNKNTKPSSAPELPAITPVESTMRDTTLYLPVMFELGEVQRHFQKQNVVWEDGNVDLTSIELGDKNNVLYARVHFSANLPSAYATPVLRRISGTLSFLVKPGCDSDEGKLKFENFDFTQATDSRLVNLIGSAARESLKNLIHNELPAQIDSLLREVQAGAQTEANQLLIQQRDALAVASPEFADLLHAANLKVADLHVQPHALQVRDGFLLCVLRVNMNLGITLE